MSETAPSSHALLVADLKGETAFDVQADAPQLEAWATGLGLLSLRKLSFRGKVAPLGKRDWRLSAKLGATVEQTCIVTLEPVRTRIDQTVTQTFVADFAEPTSAESEMPEDESTEPLARWIDLERVMLEAISLAMPDYPRKGDVAFEDAQFAAPGVLPLTDEAKKPFAGLADLRDQLKGEG